MKKFWQKTDASIWTGELILLASAIFLSRFGQGLLGGASMNFFVETLGLSGAQVLGLEGVRELPGLGLIFIAALTMRLPLPWRSAASVFIMGVGYGLYSIIHSYTALLSVAVVASLGMHMWMPLHRTLAMCLSTKDNAGRVLGSLASVGALASIAGMGILALISLLLESVSLNFYYLAGGAFIIIAAVLIARLPRDIGVTETKPPRMLIKRHYWLYYVLTFLQGSRKHVLGTFGRLVLVDKFGMKVWHISSLLLVSSAVNMVAAPHVGRMIDQHGEKRTVTLSYVLLTIGCAAFTIINTAWVLAAVFIGIRLLVMFGMGLSTYVRRIAPPEELTPTFSAGISINHVTSVIMPLIASALLPSIGYSGIFLITAVTIAVSIPFAMGLKVPDSQNPQVSAK